MTKPGPVAGADAVLATALPELAAATGADSLCRGGTTLTGWGGAFSVCCLMIGLFVGVNAV